MASSIQKMYQYSTFSDLLTPSAFHVPKISCPLWCTGGSPGGFISLLYSHFSEISGKNGDKCVFSLL